MDKGTNEYRDTPELRIFWVFPANLGVQTNFSVQLKLHGIALINGNFIKHVGHSIMNSRTP